MFPGKLRYAQMQPNFELFFLHVNTLCMGMCGHNFSYFYTYSYMSNISRTYTTSFFFQWHRLQLLPYGMV